MKLIGIEVLIYMKKLPYIVFGQAIGIELTTIYMRILKVWKSEKAVLPSITQGQKLSGPRQVKDHLCNQMEAH